MNKKGFSLIELVIVVALIAILLSVASLSSKRIIEKRALEKAKNEIALTMRSYVERSYNEGEKYTISVNTALETIEVRNSSDEIQVSIELPDILSYSTSGDGIAITDGMELSTIVEIESGSIKDGEKMEVYIYDRDGVEQHRVEMVKNESSELINVNVD